MSSGRDVDNAVDSGVTVAVEAGRNWAGGRGD
jgi:hypothetical protein